MINLGICIRNNWEIRSLLMLIRFLRRWFVSQALVSLINLSYKYLQYIIIYRYSSINLSVSVSQVVDLFDKNVINFSLRVGIILLIVGIIATRVDARYYRHAVITFHFVE